MLHVLKLHLTEYAARFALTRDAYVCFCCSSLAETAWNRIDVFLPAESRTESFLHAACVSNSAAHRETRIYRIYTSWETLTGSLHDAKLVSNRAGSRAYSSSSIIFAGEVLQIFPTRFPQTTIIAASNPPAAHLHQWASWTVLGSKLWIDVVLYRETWGITPHDK